jgi:23S rRNA pseudouridine1911/1915/1917 synthase
LAREIRAASLPRRKAFMTDHRKFTVGPEDADQRLDRFLAARLPELSRTRIQELIAEGRARVNGATAKPAHRLSADESVEVEILPRPPLEAAPEDIPIEILREDEDFVVVNKPAGMVVHAGAGAARGTLVNALLHKLGTLSTAGGALRPGIVHRLDRGTSGVLVVARNDEAHRRIAEQFRARTVEKSYLALVQGSLSRESGSISLTIARDPKRRTRMAAGRHAGREARTDWRALAHLDGYTLIEVRLHTGRTHQIRVHFSALRHSLVGDTLYGAARQVVAGKAPLPPLGRPFLHAARIGFTHPRTGQPVEVRAPLAPELRAWLASLAAALGIEQGKIDAALRGYL